MSMTSLDPTLADALKAQLDEFDDLSLDDIQRRMQWTSADVRDYVRLRSHTEIVGDCWIWTATLTEKGYALGWFRGSMRRVHRVMFMLIRGALIDALELDHTCRNRACVNPFHLDQVSHRVNVARGATLAAANTAKTECLRGHPFDDANTYISPKGHRFCRTCKNASKRADRRSR